MIVPTVGRMIHYWPGSDEITLSRPLAALVCAVIDDTHVNLTVYAAHGGSIEGRQNVEIVEDDTVLYGKYAGYARWMPYQSAVAKGEIPPVLHANAKAAYADPPTAYTPGESEGGVTDGLGEAQSINLQSNASPTISQPQPPTAIGASDSSGNAETTETQNSNNANTSQEG